VRNQEAAIYGTLAHLRMKPGQEQGILDYVADWVRDRKPQIPGAVGGYDYRLDNDPGVWVFAVAFADMVSYQANAESTAMDADSRRLRALLQEDPIWQVSKILAQF
jgi:quinol monooxygenase YgiN